MTAAIIVTSEYRLIPGRLRISIEGLRHNPQYAQHLVKVLLSEKGICAVTANPLTGRALIHFDHKLTGLPEIQQLIATTGQAYFTAEGQLQPPLAAPVTAATEVTQPQSLYTVITGGVLAGLVLKRWLIGTSPLASSSRIFNLAAITTIISGYPILRDGFEVYAKKNKINHDLILFSATLVLLAMRESLMGLSVLWLIHLTNLFRSTLQVKSNERIQNLIVNKQQKAWRVTGSHKQSVNAAALREGDIILIHPGECIPVDGQVIEGEATITQTAIAGDYQPQLKVMGDMVFAGSHVQTGLLTLRADKVGNTTSMALIACLAEEIQSKKTKTLLPDRHAGRLMGWALAIAGTVFILTYDLMRSLAVLLAGCPAALVLSRSAALGTAAVAAAERGTFMRENTALECIGNIDTVLFDKTGTLTAALPRLDQIVPLSPDYNENELLALAASAETSISHPLAKLLISEAQKRDIPLPPAPADGQSLVGYGVRAIIDKKTITVGNRLLMKQDKVPLSQDKTRITHLERTG
ncbi:MAG: kdpB 2 [Sporomusa sp.]|nr:kdpB 2 [Sporomusa sp.]